MSEIIGIIGAMESEVNALQNALSSVEKTEYCNLTFYKATQLAT